MKVKINWTYAIVGCVSIAISLFVLTFPYTDHVFDRIRIGMTEREVDRIAFFGGKRTVDLKETEWAAKSKIPEEYGKIIIYDVLFFNPIEVIFSQNGQVVMALPAYE